MIEKLIKKNRSYRKFHQQYEITALNLNDWINLARLSPSPKNKQSLKFIISHTPKKNEFIFRQLRWAGYLKNWEGPEEGEKPSAYIIILNDKEISPNANADFANTAMGIAAQSILLGAVNDGFGGCMIAAINKPQLVNLLNIPKHLDVLLVIALGKPKEEIVIENLSDTKDIRYYRDENDIHHVPKRNLNDIIIDVKPKESL